jgi:hypothetical protein
MAVISISKIQVRRGQELQTGIPQLSPGEFGWAEDTEHLYIGKRIAEGAIDDNNSRILTQQDYNNLFDLINAKSANTGTAIASTSTYKYRDGIAYVPSSTSTIAIKLDNWVSLTDFGVKESSTGSIITTQLREAIYSLFAGKDFNGTPIPGANIPDTRRQLIIPAGNYVVTDSIDLPPFTSLVGEGPSLTTIKFAPDQILNPTSMFRTVDSNGNSFSSGNMDASIFDGQNARNIHIEGITLQYTATNVSNAPLLSLDQVVDVNIKNVHFDTASLTTMTSYGNAIHIQSSVVSDVVNAPTGNINIERCRFSHLNTAIYQSTGTVNRFYISDCSFSNLQRGISIWAETVGSYYGPVNGVIDSNCFEKIVKEAIVLGTSTYSSAVGDTVSSNNTFRTVGNGADNTGNPNTDYTITTASSVILFNSRGNKTVNDSFSRQEFAEKTIIIPGNNFYYNPLVLGRTVVNNNGTQIHQTAIGTNNIIEHFPLCDHDQLISIRYQMYNDNYSRKGTLWINITGLSGNPTYLDGDPIASVSDYYNFSYINEITDPTWDFDTSVAHARNYVTLRMSEFDSYTYTIEYQIDSIL